MAFPSVVASSLRGMRRPGITGFGTGIMRIPRYLAPACLRWAGRAFAQSILAAAILCGGTHARLAAADESLVEGLAISFLEDRSGRLTIEEVSAAPLTDRFLPYAQGRDPNFGFSASAYWLKFSVSRAERDSEPLWLEIAYPLLDKLDLYSPVAAGAAVAGYTHQTAGDYLPFRERQLNDSFYHFRLDVPEGSTKTFYLRVESQSALTVPLQVLRQSQLDRLRSQRMLAFGLLYGAILALLGYNLIVTFVTRETGYLLYSVFIFTVGIGQFMYNGLAYQHLWPEAVAWNDRSPNALGFLAFFFALLFTRVFLATRTHSRTLDVALGLLATVSLLCAVAAIWIVSYATAVRVFAPLALVSSSTVFLTGAYCAWKGYRPARWFLLAWATLLAALAGHALRGMGILPANFLTVHGVQIGSWLEMVLISIALADRLNIMKQEKSQAQALALEASQRSERELEGMVEQRVQELNDVNRTLEKEVAERRNAEEALLRLVHHDALTGLPNRVLLRDRFQVAAAHAKREDRFLAVLMIDLDGFKRINDTLGHSVGDDLLVTVADRLRACVRSADTLARFGGDEFVVLLGGLRDAGEAAVVADKVIATLAEPLLVAGQQLRTTPSIGISIYPQQGNPDFDSVLKRADVAMYRAKDAGGNDYRLYLEGR